MSEYMHPRQHALQVLEFDQVYAQLVSRARSPEGRQRLSQQAFTTYARELEEIQQESQCLQELLLDAEYPLEQYPDIAQALEDSRLAGAVLELEQCAAVASYVTAADRELTFLRSHIDSGGIGQVLGAAELPREVPATINRYLDSSGRLMEERIPELQKIASRIRRAGQAARDVAHKYLQGNNDIWTSDEPALRDGRLVLPLQENFRGRMDGIVHARSGSGSTLFFEPSEVVAANNQVAEADAEYQRELHRILRRISRVIHEHRAALLQLQDVVAHIDDRCARARFALQHRAVWLPLDSAAAADSRDGGSRAIRLVQARHPLLGTEAVPISLEINGDPARFLVLSGPNTGGKTVALKTLGLCAALHQYGLPVPAADGSRLPLFSGLYADIGDEQSIELSLSTFSGHLRRLQSILAAADERALVLLDELGTGTDPDEAGPLALAACEFLAERGCEGMITTHLWAIKEFAFARTDFFNAAMAFDEETHQPTFRVVSGLPGSSHALETAAAIGLPEQVVRRAGDIYASQQSDSAAVLKQLAGKERRIAEQEAEIRQRSDDLAARERELEDLQQELQLREAEVRRGQLSELDALLTDGRSRIEAAVKEIREGGRESQSFSQARADVQQFAGEVEKARQEAQRIREAVSRRGAAGEQTAPEPVEGAQVRMLDGGKKGVLVRSAGRQRWKVAVGSITLTVHERDFQVLSRPDTGGKTTAKDTRKSPLTPQRPETPAGQGVYSIDVRGMRVHEVEAELQRVLDAALVQGSSELAVIHGKGTGALQEAVHAILGQHHAVAEFHFSRPELGGSGRTEVALRT